MSGAKIHCASLKTRRKNLAVAAMFLYITAFPSYDLLSTQEIFIDDKLKLIPTVCLAPKPNAVAALIQ